MERKSPGKYVLVFEPKYVYHQFAVCFTPSNGAVVTKIKKGTDLSYDNNKPVKKNLLVDIDKAMTSCNNLSEFFTRYINPSIFRYSGDNLHNMFIGRKNNERIYTLGYTLNNPSLNSKLGLVEGSNINDRVGINELIEFSSSPRKENKFLGFVNQYKKERKTGLTNETYDLLCELRNCRFAIENHSDSGAFNASVVLTNKLCDRLSSYKEYRELFLLKMSYVDYLEKQKEELKAIKKTTSEVKKERVSFNDDALSGEQLSLFPGDPYQNIKKLNK